jgi:hypothetical protein
MIRTFLKRERERKGKKKGKRFIELKGYLSREPIHVKIGARGYVDKRIKSYF